MIELGFTFGAMACDCEVRVVGDDEATLHAAAHEAIAEVRRIEASYSRYREDSIVSRINAAAGSTAPVPVDPETEALLDLAGHLHAASNGRFDATSGVLRQAWDFRSARVPSDSEVAALLPRVGWQHVARAPGTVTLVRPSMELDFGGFGKEYAADRAAALLLDAGVRGGFVNLGGDIRVAGPRADGSPWRFAIRHPREASSFIAEVELASGALATSGDYERCIVVDGRRHAHLLDAKTGWPVSDWASVSVVAASCTAAGALATLAMLSGNDAPALLRLQGSWFLAIDAAGRTHGPADPCGPPGA